MNSTFAYSQVKNGYGFSGRCREIGMFMERIQYKNLNKYCRQKFLIRKHGCWREVAIAGGDHYIKKVVIDCTLYLNMQKRKWN